jgi:ankyrin repeat protein
MSLRMSGLGTVLLMITSLAQGQPVPENDMALAAARQGNLALWREMLKLGASPQAVDAGGNGALVLAVLSEREEMLREVLTHRVDLDRLGNIGMTALGVAATRGHAGTVQRLLKAGARPDVADATGTTPLAIAARQGRADIVGLLLQARADPDRADEMRVTPLHLAAERGHATIVRALLEAGADPNLLDREQRSPLFLALLEQKREAAELLIAHRRTDVRLLTQGSTPRSWAERTQQQELVALIDNRLR